MKAELSGLAASLLLSGLTAGETVALTGGKPVIHGTRDFQAAHAWISMASIIARILHILRRSASHLRFGTSGGRRCVGRGARPLRWTRRTGSKRAGVYPHFCDLCPDRKDNNAGFLPFLSPPAQAGAEKAVYVIDSLSFLSLFSCRSAWFPTHHL